MNGVTVLMPVYNAGKYLELAIESISNQTYSDFEFLIYNDGSTDSSAMIIEKFAKSDKRIKYNLFDHQGYSPLLNIGVNAAQGDFIARMDSDDVAHRDRLKKQLEFLTANPEYVAVGCQAIGIDPDGDPISSMNFALRHEEIDYSQIYNAKGLMLHPGSMIRKDALTKIGGYRTEFEPGEDFDLFLRLAEVGKLANLSERLMMYRNHYKNVTVTKKQHHRHVKQKALEEAYQRRKLSTAVPQVRLNDIPDSESENHFIWMHMAITSGFFSTARKHAVLGFKKSDKKKRDYYNFFQGIAGEITRPLKKWKASLSS